MTPPLDRVREIVLAAADLPADRRAVYLAEACGGDADLRSEVERLLAADPTGADDLVHAVVGWVQTLEDGDEDDAGALAYPPGHRLGPYRLERLLGAGGSGAVYEASQESPIRRRVAVKLLRRHHTQSADLARFRAEQQILAELDHPNIAKVIDAGTTADGIAYFVLELVAGEPVTRYAASARLDRDARLELCLQACRAAEHAHARGVIHRDLKPSNILVSVAGGNPLVKVIDFGIARLADGSGTSGRTLDGMHLGTPQYMSPEQAAGLRDAGDARSDVHALGNLVQELLCGRGVYDVGDLSTPRQLRIVASGRRSLVARDEAGRPLPVDLRRIIDMATDPEPERRYRTVAALADDLERYRRRLPVAARGSGTWYLLRKTVHRHPLASGLLVALVAVVLAGLVALVAMNQRERAAARSAELAGTRSQALADYLANMMLATNPARLGPEASLGEVFEDAARRAEAELERDPLTLAQVLQVIAEVDVKRDDIHAALERLDRAEALLSREPGHTEAQRLDLLLRRAQVLGGLGRRADAESVLSVVIDAAHGRDDLAVQEARALLQQGQRRHLMGRFAAGDSAASMAIALLPESPQLRETRLRALRIRATCLVNLGRRTEAVALLEGQVAACERELGEGHPATIGLKSDLAYALGDDAFAERIRLSKEALAGAIRLRGPDHTEIAALENNLALKLVDDGRPAEALPLFEHAGGLWRRRFGERHRLAASAAANLGYAHHVMGDDSRAGDLYREALAIHDEHAQPSHAGAGLGVANLLAVSLLAQGRHDEAEAVVRGRLTAVAPGVGGPADLAWAHCVLGTILLDAGRDREAVAEFALADGINRGLTPPLSRIGMLVDNGWGCALLSSDREAAEARLGAAEQALLGDSRLVYLRLPALRRTAARLVADGQVARAGRYSARAAELEIAVRPGPQSP